MFGGLTNFLGGREAAILGFEPEVSREDSAAADLWRRQPAQGERVTAHDEDARHVEVKWRIVGSQQRPHGARHAERRHSHHGEREALAAGPGAPGQETSQTLKTHSASLQRVA